jgi:hypothetical protein
MRPGVSTTGPQEVYPMLDELFDGFEQDRHGRSETPRRRGIRGFFDRFLGAGSPHEDEDPRHDERHGRTSPGRERDRRDTDTDFGFD